jgi:hypothetical protein
MMLKVLKMSKRTNDVGKNVLAPLKMRGRGVEKMKLRTFLKLFVAKRTL